MSLRASRSVAMALILCAVSGAVSAQEQPAPATTAPGPAATSSTPAAIGIPVPAGTPVVIEIAESLASSTHKRGDVFAIKLMEPLLLDGAELVPAGTRGTGEIVHAAPARSGGAPGELLIAARTLETPHGQLLLRGFRLGATGDDNSGMALGVAFAAGPFAMFIRGREIVIPAGTPGIARTRIAPPAEVLAPTRGSDSDSEPAVPSRPDTPVPSKE